MVGDIRPLWFLSKFGGGSFTFADTPRELEKRERERRHLCESVYILWASMSIHVTHVCRMQLLVHPPTSLLTLDLCGFCRNLEEAVSLLQILLGSLKKGSESAGICVSQCIYIYAPNLYTVLKMTVFASEGF